MLYSISRRGCAPRQIKSSRTGLAQRLEFFTFWVEDFDFRRQTLVFEMKQQQDSPPKHMEADTFLSLLIREATPHASLPL